MSSDEHEARLEELWLEEIIRETEHYFQGEIQQEQRASWILATVGVLIVLLIGIQLQPQNVLKSPVSLINISLLFFYLSGIFSLITIIPLNGTRIRRDLFGQSYRRYKTMSIEGLIRDKFRYQNMERHKEYKDRLFYHFRAHFLRVRFKEYGVVWSSIFMLIGFIVLGIVGVIQVL